MRSDARRRRRDRDGDYRRRRRARNLRHRRHRREPVVVPAPGRQSPHFFNFDRVAGIYDRTRALPPAAAREMATGIAAITRATNPEPVILEVGVGSGRIAGPLAEAGLQVLGVDISCAMLANLRRVAPAVAAIRAEAAHLPFRPRSLDAVLFVHILHLVPEPVAAVEAAITCVRPGGLLLELRTLAAPGPLDLVRRRIREESALLLGTSAGSSRFEAGSAALEACILDRGGALERGVICRWEETETLRDVLVALERRVYSAAWSLSDAQARRMAVQLATEAEVLAGGLDAPQRTAMTMLLTAGTILTAAPSGSKVIPGAAGR